ncbi:hypothetical protein CHISP_3251 [Chitinispirillum alkaliphilum]|nr:hypothetical protein CHISP_3251 [Chitinispirillum alkaliphilum]
MEIKTARCFHFEEKELVLQLYYGSGLHFTVLVGMHVIVQGLLQDCVI